MLDALLAVAYYAGVLYLCIMTGITALACVIAGRV